MLFRVDASREIGAGHIMRCLALAEGLNNQDWEVIFAFRELQDSSNWFMHVDGELLPISTKVPIRNEPDYIQAHLSGPVDLIVTDHYAINAQWHAACRPFARAIMAIDDLADRYLDCDILLNQNLGASDAAYDVLVPQLSSRLVGPRYALLRPQFALARESMEKRQQGIRRILITMGGTDPLQQTAKALDAAGLLKATGLHLDVVISRDSPDWDLLQDDAACLSHNVTFHQSVKDMTTLMVQADLAIGTAGVTALERCALQLPSILLEVAENQQVSAASLGNCGAAINLGWYENITAEMIAAEVEELMRDRDKVGEMQLHAGRLVDGNGIKRVVTAINQLSGEGCGLRFREMIMDDARLLLDWANDPVVRNNSFHPEPIHWESHMAWLGAKLADENCLFLMAEQHNMPVGHVRFGISGSNPEISITVSPLMRGRGIGQLMLQQALLKLAELKPEINVVAHVKKDNTASQHLFESSGFKNITVNRADCLTYACMLSFTDGGFRH